MKNWILILPIFSIFFEVQSAPTKSNRICFENEMDRMNFISNLHDDIKKDAKLLFENFTKNEEKFNENCSKIFNKTEHIFDETKHCFHNNQESYRKFQELIQRMKKISFICEFDSEIRDCEFFK
jgi:hypothetical protein